MTCDIKNWPIGRMTSFLFRYSQSYFARRLAPFGIGRGQYVFLAELRHREGVCQDELAARLSMDKGTTARALQALEREGYVERRRDTGDRRYNRLFLTDKARACRPELKAELHGWSEILFEGFSPAEREQALALTGRMVANVLRRTEADKATNTNNPRETAE